MKVIGAMLMLLGFMVTVYMSYVVWTALQLNMWKWGLLMFVGLLAHVVGVTMQHNEKKGT